MKTIKINKTRVTKQALAAAVKVLRSGGVVVHPSESSYGLAIDPTNPEAIKLLFRLKRRSSGKPVLLAASSLLQASSVVRLSSRLKELALRHWPSPLTVIAPARKRLDLAGTGRPTRQIAVRVPADIWLRALAEEFGHPVTSTSVNLSGHPAAYSASEVRRTFAGRKYRPDLLLDAGTLPPQPPSTVVRQCGRNIIVLR